MLWAELEKGTGIIFRVEALLRYVPILLPPFSQHFSKVQRVLGLLI